MMMLTKENRKNLQPLYATEDKLDEVQVAVKFFDPYGSWTWYAWEFDGEDLFFGLVVGMETELGYFSLSELESLKTPSGYPNRIERDRHYRQEMVCELLDRKGYG